MSDLSLTLKYNQWSRGINDGHLSGHLDSLVACGISSIVSNCILTGLLNIDRVIHHKLDFSVVVIRQFSASIGILCTALMSNVSLSV